MQYGGLNPESLPQATHELWGKTDFGNENQHLFTGVDHVANDGKIDLCLAATGDAIK